MTLSIFQCSWYTCLGLGIVFLISLKLMKRFIRRRNYKLPPGPQGLPLLGTLGSVDHVTLWDHRDRFGDVSYLNALGTDIVIFNSAKVIRDAFQGQETAEVFAGRPNSIFRDYFKFDDIIMRSLNEENWKPLRQMLHSSLKQYGEGIVALEGIVSEELEVLIGTLNKRVGQTFDIMEQLSFSLVNILCILIIGERFDYDDWKLKLIPETIRIQNQLAHPFADLVLRTLPFLRFFPVGLGALVQSQYETQQRLLAFLYRDYKHLNTEELEAHDGVVFNLMREQKTNAWMKDTKIEGLIQNLIGAGFATTDASLRVFFLVLLYYPHVQERLQNEIDEIVGQNRRPNLKDRDNMPYTMATILELLRYASIVPLSVPHSCLADATFRGHTIPRDSVILPNLFRIHHDPEIWSDPSVFNPTRFLDDSGALLPSTHRIRQNLVSFGVGKRLCMGENFAKTRLFLFITYLLQVFSVKRVCEIPSCDPRTFIMGMVLLIPHYKLYIERRFE